MSVNPPKVEVKNFGLHEQIEILNEVLNEFDDLLKIEKNNSIKGGIRSCMEIVYQKKKMLTKK